MRSRLIGGVVALLASAVFGGLVAAAPAAAHTTHSRLHVVVAVDRFAISHHSTTAHGTVTANLTDQAGHHTVLRAPLTLSASTGGACDILNLNLQQLNLVLLGLNVHLDRVHLVVTGQSRGGVLGSLFCKLAHAHATAARVAVARTMNASLRRHPLRPMAFTVPLRPAVAQQAAASCPVLDLILGPLNLNLLGLVVNLNQVHLTITATPGGGTLGDLFCNLSK
ncbi:MAG TPA: hypothetical protein VFN87_13055 [Solirubrobacteraceae bacterium]|nr:hypothetical protein [Solirubrobacteraceae bacterium]